MRAGYFMLVIIALTAVSAIMQWTTIFVIGVTIVSLAAITGGAILRLVDWGYCTSCNKRIWMARSRRQGGSCLESELFHMMCPHCNNELKDWTCG